MPANLLVDANYRFIAASQEVNARIVQRQQALALYITLTVSLLAALVALKSVEVKNGLPVEWLIWGFPTASVCLALLNYKAERSITNLRQFMSALEKLERGQEILPSYNTHPEWANAANSARRFHDYAAAVLVLGGSGVGICIAAAIYQDRISFSSIEFIFSAALIISSAIGILMCSKWSYKPQISPSFN